MKGSQETRLDARRGMVVGIRVTSGIIRLIVLVRGGFVFSVRVVGGSCWFIIVFG